MLLLEPRHRRTSSLSSSCLWNDVLASRLLTKHAPANVIVLHSLTNTALYLLRIGSTGNACF